MQIKRHKTSRNTGFSLSMQAACFSIPTGWRLEIIAWITAKSVTRPLAWSKSACSLSFIPSVVRTSESFRHVEQKPMKKDDITKFELDPNHPPQMSAEELARLDAMTEEEVHAAALADADNLPLTDEELARLKRVPNTIR